MEESSNIILLIDNSDFIDGFCDIVTRELEIPCDIVQSEDDIEGKKGLIVTNRKLVKDYNLPVVSINLPVYMRSLISDIEYYLKNNKDNDILILSDDYLLSIIHKNLTCKNNGISISLTDKEAQILRAFAICDNSEVSREYLLKEVWKIEEILDTHTMETHIYRLRKKIKDSFGIDMIKATANGYKII
ncbi:MAG: helix-turn-helix domain-containing protein [Rickettsiales bacterium]